MNPTTPKSWMPNMQRYIDHVLVFFLYISSDYIECQYSIRALSQSMSKPTVNSFACLRHLCMYLLGCIENCLILTYKGHHGLLHYTPEDYRLEVFSDSD